MPTQFFKIFRTGTHTTMAGQALTFAENDLSATAAAYPHMTKKAPLVLGHPADDGPALGTVLGLHYKDGALFALADASDELTGLVRAKKCVSVSCAFFPKDDPRNPAPGVWGLKHIGFLGSQPPAVKGLGPLEFAEPIDGVSYVNGSFGLSFVDLSGMGAEVSFSQMQQGITPMQKGREALHQVAQRTAAAHPEFSYIDAVRIFESGF